MAELIGFLALFAIPVVAGRLAIQYAQASPKPESMWLRGFLGTWILCVVLGVALGLVVDLLSWVLGGRGFMIAAFAAYGLMQFFVGAVCALVVGIICRRKARERISRQG